jgi:hypothetical protein
VKTPRLPVAPAAYYESPALTAELQALFQNKYRFQSPWQAIQVGLEDTKKLKITEWDCLSWAKAFSETASPSRYNHTLGTLRAIIQVAIEDGYTVPNPAMKAEKRRFPTIVKPPS